MRSNRAAAQLDDVSAHLAEVLRQADALLAEWSKFGATVRAQVEREAATIGSAVAAGVDSSVERTLATRLGSLSKELDRLERRARAIAEQRETDRRLLSGIAIGVAIAVALLAILVFRGPAKPAAAPVPQPLPVESSTEPATPSPIPAEPAATTQVPAGSATAAAAPKPVEATGSAAAEPAKSAVATGSAARTEPASTVHLPPAHPGTRRK